MNYALIAGSHRSPSQSARIAGVLAERLAQLPSTKKTSIIDLGTNPLPFWDQEGRWKESFAPFSKILTEANGLVIISPEWGGMATPAIKNFLLCTQGEMRHKPALLVSVTSSLTNGSYPITEMRSSGYKNTMPCFLPEHLIYRDAEKVFIVPNPVIEERTQYTLELLAHYTQALGTVRTWAQKSPYLFGM